MSTAAAPALLEVDDLETRFVIAGRDPIVAVSGVSFSAHAGETTAIVGESGSGKSVTALSITRLLPARISQISRGSIRLRGRELTALSEAELRTIRGREIGMIFQEPMTSLNPVHRIGAQITEVLTQHQDLAAADARERTISLLETVGIAEPSRRIDSYPHELSGGMRQRVMIAIALACNPSLLIADEPTTALDVTIQAQILELMRDLQSRLGMAIVFITHDLGVVAQMARQIVVMYAGQVVERGPVDEIFAHPRMPYTAGLLASIPRLGTSTSGRRSRARRLATIPGNVPAPSDVLVGCRFAARCEYAQSRCRDEAPTLVPVSDGHDVRCHRWAELDLSSAGAS